MFEPQPIQNIADEMYAEIVDADGHSTPVTASFGYDPTDPFAIRIDFGAAPDLRSWVFARELLISGFLEPCGDGDVQVFPCLDCSGSAVVVIELECDGGEVMVQVDSRDVSGFIRRMLELVPTGAESCAGDLDAELCLILDQAC